MRRKVVEVKSGLVDGEEARDQSLTAFDVYLI